MAPRALVTAAVVVVVLAGCTPEQKGELTPAPLPTATAEPEAVGPVQPVGEATVIATGLNVPWSIVRLESGSTLISERNTALVKELLADGTVREVATIPGVVPAGEGGLLGLEYVPSRSGAGTPWLYAYFTAASDNRIVRFPLEGDVGGYSLGEGDEVLTGLAKANNHDGGRIKLGPDGMLYATVGDAANPPSAQDPASPNGKILRMDLDGSAPDDNPFPDSLVYSLGHRNPQGIAWDRDGRLWAAEFGQNTWDEFNAIVPGGNYGWPVIEGSSDDARFINPVYQWPTDDASPSGLAWTQDTFFMAGLGGERLWALYPGNPTSAVEWFTGQYGRIRDVVPGPDGSLWMLTNNTDGRGAPRDGDDKLLEVRLSPLVEG